MDDLTHKKETLDGALSYGIGGGGFSIATLASYEHEINAVILIFSLIIVLVRLAFDLTKYIDYLRARPPRPPRG